MAITFDGMMRRGVAEIVAANEANVRGVAGWAIALVSGLHGWDGSKRKSEDMIADMEAALGGIAKSDTYKSKLRTTARRAAIVLNKNAALRDEVRDAADEDAALAVLVNRWKADYGANIGLDGLYDRLKGNGAAPKQKTLAEKLVTALEKATTAEDEMSEKDVAAIFAACCGLVSGRSGKAGVDAAMAHMMELRAAYEARKAAPEEEEGERRAA